MFLTLSFYVTFVFVSTFPTRAFRCNQVVDTQILSLGINSLSRIHPYTHPYAKSISPITDRPPLSSPPPSTCVTVVDEPLRSEQEGE